LARWDARLDELSPICLSQVDLGPPAEPEVNGDFRPYFEATASDSRPNGHPEVLWHGPEPVCHGLYCLRTDFEDGTAPARVNRGHGPVSNIRHQDRQTVGSSNRQQHSRLVGNEGIALPDHAPGIGR
jgi:hypothetical protein